MKLIKYSDPSSGNTPISNASRSSHFKILALDGGGIRGVLGAKILTEFQESLPHPIVKYFDLVVGTSTGGITAIALGMGLSPSSILEMYRENASRLFPDNMLARLRRLIGAKHDSSTLHSLLHETFGRKTLGDSECRLCIPTLDETSGKIKVLKTDHHPDLFVDHLRPAWEVAAATAAAPFYYPSFRPNDSSALLDGGIWANNPSLVGLCEAMKLFHVTPLDVAILSVGTGEETCGTGTVQPSNLGILGLTSINRLVRLAFAAQSQAIDQVMNCLGTGSFIRINPNLSHTIALDDSAEIPYLVAVAAQAAQETLGQVKRVFFGSIVRPFIAEHKKRGDGR